MTAPPDVRHGRLAVLARAKKDLGEPLSAIEEEVIAAEVARGVQTNANQKRLAARNGEREAPPTSGPLVEEDVATQDARTSVMANPDLRPEAFHGPIGEYVQVVAPHTEAHEAAVLIPALVMYGALIGRSPAQYLDGARHGTNLFVAVLGPTSFGRKGSGVRRARRLISELDPDFSKANVAGGLSTGEGLIFRLRDASATATDGESKSAEPGVTDKRLLVMEDELGVALRRASGRENSLLQIVRLAWDGDTLQTMTRRHAMTATDPHVCIVAQGTPGELVALTSSADFAGGTLNRFLFCYTERVRLLPDGGDPPAERIAPLLRRLHIALGDARKISRLALAEPGAGVWWRDHYAQLTTGAPGRHGDATRRAAPMVRRLAAIYALSEGRREITVRDLEAALAVWDYSFASAARVFGRAALSDRAARLLAAIDAAGRHGASRSDLRAVVGNSVPAREIVQALGELRDAGLARVAHSTDTGGRPREIWRSVSVVLRAEVGGKGDNGGCSECARTS